MNNKYDSDYEKTRQDKTRQDKTRTGSKKGKIVLFIHSTLRKNGAKGVLNLSSIWKVIVLLRFD